MCLWNVYETDSGSPRTNNHVEGWHNKLKLKRVASSLSIFTFPPSLPPSPPHEVLKCESLSNYIMTLNFWYGYCSFEAGVDQTLHGFE